MLNQKELCTKVEKDLDNYLHSIAEQSRRLKASCYGRTKPQGALKALVVHNGGQSSNLSFELTEFLLERECRTVLHARSVLEVVDILSENDINIIVVDMDYQNSNNPDFIKFIDHIISDFSDIKRDSQTQVVCLSKNKMRLVQPYRSVNVYGNITPQEPLSSLDKTLRGAGEKSRSSAKQLRTYRAIDIA